MFAQGGGAQGAGAQASEGGRARFESQEVSFSQSLLPPSHLSRTSIQEQLYIWRTYSTYRLSTWEMS